MVHAPSDARAESIAQHSSQKQSHHGQPQCASCTAKAQRVTRIGFCIIKHQLQVAVFWNRPLLQGLRSLDIASTLPFLASSARTRLREALFAERPPCSVGEGSNPKTILRLSLRG